MARSEPVTLSLPSFTGATRKLILLHLASFFGLGLLHWIVPAAEGLLIQHVPLVPWQVVHGQVWQLVTYAFLNVGLLSTAFSLLSLWYIGAWLEGSFGPRWFYELYFVSIVGGAALATGIAFLHLPTVTPYSQAFGPSVVLLGPLLAIARFFGDQEILFFFVIRMKVKYLVAIYIVIYLAELLRSADAFGALVSLSCALAAYIYVQTASRRGLSFAMTERYYALRNEFYRNKRRRAAKKFEVYMRAQNREVHFDKDGRYIEDDRRDPNDKRWMN